MRRAAQFRTVCFGHGSEAGSLRIAGTNGKGSCSRGAGVGCASPVTAQAMRTARRSATDNPDPYPERSFQ
ncbi:hypothetical protein RC1_3137 [Rhodospirillum centenum SW]|uniref:Uncharacterized protein n=1 Tax=Rhodospirillum centenum (strain ATCC 51521 / SW) TaxID=414684 RepID=B6IW28_RHOCS|nr:hypothetical protein RC1_3137 [Rhodospirillum centenum SW]